MGYTKRMRRLLALAFVSALMICSGRVATWASEEAHACCRTGKAPGQTAITECCPASAISTERPHLVSVAAPNPVPTVVATGFVRVPAREPEPIFVSSFRPQSASRGPPLG